MTNYPPELIEDFEKLAKAQRWDTARDYDDCFIDPQMPKALAAFAHNWHRVRELEEVLREIIAYREGEGKYDFSCMADEVRGVAAFDAWDAIEQKARKLLDKGND